MEDYEITITNIRSMLYDITARIRSHRAMCTKCGATKIGAAEDRDGTLVQINQIHEAINLLEGQLDEAIEDAVEEATERLHSSVR